VAIAGLTFLCSLCLQVMLMGSSTGVPEKKAAVVFVEDMTPEQAAKAGAMLPAGLKNLGNTCYMNSTLQCLRAVPELRESLTKDSALVVPGSMGGGDVALAATLKDLFVGLEGSSAAMFPARFWSALKARYDTFAEVGPGYVMLRSVPGPVS
jgi:ubiquitin carboxyl-terminal hydrolase 14